jgi:signal recognition particle GTPase
MSDEAIHAVLDAREEEKKEAEKHLSHTLTLEQKDAFVREAFEALKKGKTLQMWCAFRRKNDKSYPHESTIRSWIVDNRERYFDDYLAARAASYGAIMDEMVRVSYNMDNDTIHTERGEKQNKEWILRSRLIVDTWKFYLSKIAPRLEYKKTMKEQCGEIVERMLSQDLDPEIAQSIMNVLHTQSQILRDDELNERIKVLEEKLKPNSGK